jgi:hypothetical protein
MKRFIFFILFIALVLIIIFVSRGEDENTNPTIREFEGGYTEDGEELYELTSSDSTEIKNFVSGVSYLIPSSQGDYTLVFQSSNENTALFTNENNQDVEFTSNLAFVVREGVPSQEVEDWFSEQEDIISFDGFSIGNIYQAEFSSPYQAYLKLLEYSENELFLVVEPDFVNTATNGNLIQ